MQKRLVKVITLIALAICQEIPNEFYQFQSEKLRLDAGENWDRNTTFGPLRFKHGKNITDSLQIP